MKKTISRSLLCAVLLMALAACGSKMNITVKENVETEYGKELDTAALYDKEQSDEDVKVKEVKNFDSKKIGEQEITVVFVNGDDKTSEEKIKIQVKDTANPEIKFKKDAIELTEGDKFDPASNIESVKDPIDGDIKKSDDEKITKNGYIIASDVNNKKAGNYTVKVTAYDVNGNKAEKSYKVTVKAKPVEQQQTSTSQPASGSGQSSSGAASAPVSQGGGSTSGGSGSAPQPQPQPQQCVSNGQFGAVGNSGKVFVGSSTEDGLAKAEAWANSVIYDESSPYYMKGYHAWTVYDNCGERNDVWTVEFY